ncbi:VCBS repeat-containing protein [Patescibacteria group bacterium]|nr:VCBS repeat-containing protein [Patescibacteria group bacterium]
MKTKVFAKRYSAGVAVFIFTFVGFLVLFCPGLSSAASIITGAGSGGGPHVRSFDEIGDVEDEPDKLMAYANSYRGGVRVATGDIDADGEDEIITGTGENGGPHLRVFEKDGTQRGIEFFPFDSKFRGGMDVAAGDFDDDGKEDIAVSQFSNGQAWVKVYRYNTAKTVLFEANVFGNIECGATVAMGDVDDDGKDELIVGAGTGGGPLVRVYDYNENSQTGTLKPIQFFAFAETTRTGVDVAAGDTDDDGKAEIAVSQLKNGQAWVKVYRYNNEQTVLGNWNAYGDPAVGANIDMIDIDDDDEAEIITGAGNGGGPQVRAFEEDGTLSEEMDDFFAYDSKFRGGVDVAGFTEESTYTSPWNVEGEKIIAEPHFFDVSVVQLSDGRYRMYGELYGSIKSYVSDDGLDWRAEAGTRMESAAFPYVTGITGGWRMFYVPAGGGLEQNQFLSAVSSDGLTFTQEDGIRYTAGSECDTISGPRIIELDNGSSRLYYTGVSGSGSSERSDIFSAVASDGLNFTHENGMRINSTVSPLIGSRAAHAFPIENSAGEIELYFAGATGNGGGIFSAVSNNGLDFTINPYPQIQELGNSISPQDPYIIETGNNWRMYYGLYRGAEVVTESGIYLADKATD